METTMHKMYAVETGEDHIFLCEVTATEAQQVAWQTWYHEGWDMVTIPTLNITVGQKWRDGSKGAE